TVAMRGMGFREFNRYWQSGVQLIQETSLSTSADGDSRGHERPLPLDPIPLVMAENEWGQIEKAGMQRATLLNAMLFDLYGNLRLCFEIPPPDGVPLPPYAADLARSPQGRWWVIADPTQAPAGMGYALENR